MGVQMCAWLCVCEIKSTWLLTCVSVSVSYLCVVWGTSRHHATGVCSWWHFYQFKSTWAVIRQVGEYIRLWLFWVTSTVLPLQSRHGSLPCHSKNYKYTTCILLLFLKIVKIYVSVILEVSQAYVDLANRALEICVHIWTFRIPTIRIE